MALFTWWCWRWKMNEEPEGLHLPLYLPFKDWTRKSWHKNGTQTLIDQKPHEQKKMTILPAVLAASASDGRIEQEKVDMKMEPKHWLTKSLMNKKTWPSYLLSWGVLPYPSLPEWKEKIFLLSVSMEQNGDKLNTKWRCLPGDVGVERWMKNRKGYICLSTYHSRIEQEKVDIKMEPKHWLTKSHMNKKKWPSYLLSWPQVHQMAGLNKKKLTWKWNPNTDWPKT